MDRSLGRAPDRTGDETRYLVRGEALPGPGDTAQGEDFQEGPGGKGANQAVAAAHTTTKIGAQAALPRRQDVDALLARTPPAVE